MTEHGAYVWPSYGIVAVVLLLLVVQTLRAFKRTAKELEQAEARIKSPTSKTEPGE
jgi:heme exporter protein CcmD